MRLKYWKISANQSAFLFQFSIMNKIVKVSILSVFALLILSETIWSQSDSVSQVVENVVVSATRISTSAEQVPIAISRYKADEVQSIRQQLSLQEYIAAVPGLFSLNANNYAQDLRISIRGFGARASFGIRGIKIIVDGVPETTPDGQGQIDNLNLGIIDNIEVIRGPASSLYGNASGGVIQINTLDHVDQPFVELGTAFGAFGMQQYQASIGKSMDSGTTVIAQGSYNTGNGYRDNSGYKNWNFNGHVNHKFQNKAKLIFNLNYSDSPQADDPGGVNLEDRNSNPSAARDRNVMLRAGEAISQFKASSSYNLPLGENGELSAYGYGATRSFDGFIPVEFGGSIELDRTYYGVGANYQIKSIGKTSVNKLQFGVDINSQDDTRLRFMNNGGVRGDEVSFMNDIFTALGFYIIDQFEVGSLLISGGLRYDRNSISSDSRVLGVGDAMTSLDYNSLNPSLGITFKSTDNSAFFGNYSRSFETPSLSELFFNPTGGPGLNTELNPQIANSFELGYRYFNDRFSVEAVLYRVNTQDDLVPFQLEDLPELTFFRNAGKTKRQGIEVSGQLRLVNSLVVQSSYTYSDFSYEDFVASGTDFSGNVLPGVPKHNFVLSIKNNSTEGLIYHIEGRVLSELFADDSNTNVSNGYTLVNAQIGYSWNVNSTMVRPYIGVNNLLNVDYNDNVRLNAFGGRHYEAGPPIHLFGGIKVRF